MEAKNEELRSARSELENNQEDCNSLKAQLETRKSINEDLKGISRMDSLNIILKASQNVKYSSMTKKSLTNRFYEFLCSVAELKHISRGDEILFDKIEEG